MAETKALFDQWVDMPQEELDRQEHEIMKGELKRHFEEKFDKAVSGTIALERARLSMLKSLKNTIKDFDLDTFREIDFKVEQYKEAQEEIKKLYVKFFGEEMSRK